MAKSEPSQDRGVGADVALELELEPINSITQFTEVGITASDKKKRPGTVLISDNG